MVGALCQPANPKAEVARKAASKDWEVAQIRYSLGPQESQHLLLVIVPRHFASGARIVDPDVFLKSISIFVSIAGSKIFLRALSIFIPTALIAHLHQWLELSVTASVRGH